jgi:type IV secretion system protein VirB2
MRFRVRNLATFCFVMVAVVVVCSTVDVVFAGQAGAGGLPWEGPLQKIQQSITGPVAMAIALAAIAIAGAMLIFGGELNDFARRLCYIVLVAGLLLGAQNVISLFGAGSGATIGEATSLHSISEDVTWKTI